MSNVHWFYSDAQEQRQGPLSFEQIQQLVANGEIQPNTLIWNEHLPEWAAASSVPGVFNPGAKTPPNPYSNPALGQSAPVGGLYPIPRVKKTSFALWLLIYFASLIVLSFSFGAIVEAAPPPPDLPEENRQMAQAETEKEVREANEALRRKTEEYANGLSEKSLADLGINLGALIFGWIFSLLAAIYAYIILYRAWCILQPGEARTTPGQAVGFCFIPIFNIYWIFNVYSGWATDWTRIRNSYSNLQDAPKASNGLFIAAMICMITLILMPIGIILFMIFKKQMCDTINYCAAHQQAAL